MSMPQYLVVAVISGEINFGGEQASAVAAILTGKNKEHSVAPYIFPVSLSKCRLSLTEFGISQGYAISSQPAYPRLINPREVDIWLALDQDGIQEAQARIKKDGSASNGFYRGIFPEPVISCGFSVPKPPSEPNFQDWFSLLTEKFEPWKQHIWTAFSNSS